MKKTTANNHQPNSGGSQSAADQAAARLARGYRLISLLGERLCIPTPRAFLAEHSRALDAPPVTVPGSDFLCVPLFGPATPCERHIEDIDSFSPEQQRRLNQVLNAAAQDPGMAEEDFVVRAAAALDRVPLGEVFLTEKAAASSIPAPILYLSLFEHRRCREGGPASAPPESGPPFIVTKHGQQDGDWPAFSIVTAPDGGATLLILQGEVPGAAADPARN